MNRQPGQGQRTIRIIVGRAGNGKTTLLRRLLAHSCRALVFDPLGVMAPGLVVTNRRQMEEWIDAELFRRQFRLIYRPKIDEADGAGMKAEADWFCFVAR